MTTQYSTARWWDSYAQESIATLAAVLSVAAAAIHFAILGEHFAEFWLYGVFFAVVAWSQLAWAMFILRKPARWLYWVGAAGNAAVIAIWAVTRTAGVPVGPIAGEVEAMGFSDALTTVFEMLIVLACLALAMRTPKESRTPARGASWPVMFVIALAIASATTAALVDLETNQPASIANALTNEEFQRLANDGYVLGNPDAPVTLLESGDFQ